MQSSNSFIDFVDQNINPTSVFIVGLYLASCTISILAISDIFQFDFFVFKIMACITITVFVFWLFTFVARCVIDEYVY